MDLNTKLIIHILPLENEPSSQVCSLTKSSSACSDVSAVELVLQKSWYTTHIHVAGPQRV